MRFLFSLALVGIPVLDVASLIVVGRSIGAWQTVVLVVVSGTVGVTVIRARSFSILAQARESLRRGVFPARQAFEGACALIGGALLILPGFVSDVIGLVLLFPPCRALLLNVIGRRAMRSGHFAFWDVRSPPPPSSPQAGAVIEGEFRTVEPTSDAVSAEDTVCANSGAVESPWRRAGNVVPPRET